MQDDDVVYGICLPATGFSALFVFVSLLTVISIIVSGFVCYQRQLQKVAEESAPSGPVGPGQAAGPPPPMVAAAAAAGVAQMTPVVGVQQHGWGFNTWFRKTQEGRRGIRPVMY